MEKLYGTSIGLDIFAFLLLLISIGLAICGREPGRCMCCCECGVFILSVISTLVITAVGEDELKIFGNSLNGLEEVLHAVDLNLQGKKTKYLFSFFTFFFFFLRVVSLFHLFYVVDLNSQGDFLLSFPVEFMLLLLVFCVFLCCLI
jgi:hypothetical protein